MRKANFFWVMRPTFWEECQKEADFFTAKSFKATTKRQSSSVAVECIVEEKDAQQKSVSVRMGVLRKRERRTRQRCEDDEEAPWSTRFAREEIDKIRENQANDMEEEVLVKYKVRKEGQVQIQRRRWVGEWPESQTS